MRKREYQELDARLVSGQQGQNKLGLGRALFEELAEKCGAVRTFHRRKLYDLKPIEEALDYVDSIQCVDIEEGIQAWIESKNH